MLAVCGTTAYSYLSARAALIAEIDKDLLMAARAVRYILPDLTGLGNRRAFSDAMELEVARARRHGGEFSLAILDLDRFKSINDGYGHEVGDRVLVAFADTAAAVLRGPEVLNRIGGEEFALLLPGSGLAEAVRASEGLRERVARISIDTPGGRLEDITVSIGVASSAEVALDPEAIQRLADARLYLAKAAGRDRVVAHGAMGPLEQGTAHTPNGLHD